ncbi:MAG: chemotaxis protein CheC [Calditerricola sp.]|nr:chemotaxis protein CheC [Calditerricola sp.]
MDLFSRLDEFQFDVLREVGNIGSGHAVTALSTLLQRRVHMHVPQVKLVPFDAVADVVGGPEAVVAAVFLRVEGDVPGSLFFLMDLATARRLLSALLGASPGEEGFNEMESSALQEIGNILSGSYLSSLADLTGLRLQPSIPALAIDMAGALLSVGLHEVGRVGDMALVIDTTFAEGEDVLDSHFVLIPEPEAVDRLFRALGVPLL